MAKSRSHSWSRKKKSRPKILSAVGVLIVLVAAGCFLLFIVKKQQPEPSLAPSESTGDSTVKAQADYMDEEALAAASLDAGSLLEEVILKHYAITKLDKVETLKMRAMLQLGDTADRANEHELLFYFRRPNLVRRVMTQDGMRLDVGFDGVEIWAQQVAPNGLSREVEDIPETQKKRIREAARIGSYLELYREEPEQFTYLGEEIVDDVPCHSILFEDDALRVTTYIDQREFLEVGRREESKDGSPAISISMSDFRNVEGVVLAFCIRSTINGALYSVATVSEIDINNGVPSYLFKEPSVRHTSLPTHD